MDEGSKMVLANPKYRTKAYIIKVRMVYSGKAQDIVVYKTCINKINIRQNYKIPFLPLVCRE